MSLSAQFKTDNDKEVNGVPVTFGENADGSVPTFTVSRMSRTNQRYAKALERASKPYKRQIDNGTFDAVASEKLLMSVFVDSVLTGWDNILLSDVTGNPDDKGFAMFSRENALALFTNLPELYAELSGQANNLSLYRAAELEADAGN